MKSPGWTSLPRVFRRIWIGTWWMILLVSTCCDDLIARDEAFQAFSWYTFKAKNARDDVARTKSDRKEGFIFLCTSKIPSNFLVLGKFLRIFIWMRGLFSGILSWKLDNSVNCKHVKSQININNSTREHLFAFQREQFSCLAFNNRCLYTICFRVSLLQVVSVRCVVFARGL